MTKADKIYKVKCTYDMSSKNITFGMMPIRDPEMIHINSSPEAPPPRIRILDTRQREVETVRIGDRLNFRIEIPEDSKCKLNFCPLCPINQFESTLLLFSPVEKERFRNIFDHFLF